MPNNTEDCPACGGVGGDRAGPCPLDCQADDDDGAGYEAYLDSFYGGDGPPTFSEQQDAARRLK